MNIAVQKVDNSDLLKPLENSSKEHNNVKNTIKEAINRQYSRYGKKDVYNSSLSSHQVSTLLKLSKSAEQFLYNASKKLDLSARSYFKVIKVAQTIADLDGAPEISEAHLSEALTFRKR